MTPVLASSYYKAYIPSISSSLYSRIKSVWKSVQEILGTPLRLLAFPLTLSKLPLEYQQLLEGERKFFSDFWNPNVPLNPQFPWQEDIRSHFFWKKETLSLEIEGKPVWVEYSIIEPKEGEKPLNFLYMPGNVATNDSYILGPYPFLVSALKQKEKGLPRILILSQYDIYKEPGEKYHPRNIDEPGLIFSHVLKALSREKGPIHFLAAHSYGTVVLASSLKHLAPQDLDLLPQTIYLDRGPSSVKEAASLFFGTFWWFVFQWARLTHWNLDMGQEIFQSLSHRKDQTLLIAETKKDSFFKGKASLVQSPFIQSLEKQGKAKCFRFDFAYQHCMPRAHHMLHNGLLDEYHLTEKNNLLQPGENMADLAIKLFHSESSKNAARSPT